ncbi:BTAD domain-containing putative transcriptional regulator [Lentzea sp. NPDC051213]|uniref:BTAD domain-containing putative transcriptional regulator n=1 Tax=Lentzea sp. NPDC051213 TaxID=3364126 RepID=UPI0037A958B1
MYLRLLGTLELLGADGARIVISAPKRRAVLAMLGRHLNSIVSFDQLVLAVWGENPPANVRTALQTHVWALRKLLDPAVSLRTEGAGYVLIGPAGATDWDRFHALVASAREENAETALTTLKTALGLWRGDALSDVPRTDTLDVVVQELEEHRLSAVEELAERLLALGKPVEALSLLIPDAAKHPFRESVIRLLMIAYSHSGQQARAIATYHKVREQLSTELGVDPSPLLRTAFEAILRGTAHEPETSPAARSVPTAVPAAVLPRREQEKPSGLVNRTAELERLRGFTDELKAGRGGVACVRGEAGIGKSALVSALVDEMREAGMRVCTGSAERVEHGMPFSAISAALGLTGLSKDPDIIEIMRTLRGQTASSQAYSSRAEVDVVVTGLITALVEKWCTQTPLLIVMEDFHWADDASALVLHMLGRNTGLMPLGLLMTVRTGALKDHNEDVLQRMASRSHAVFVDMGPLPEPEIVELAERTLGTSSGRRLRALLSDAAGNPLYAIELVRGIQQDKGTRTENGVVDVDERAAKWLSPSLLAVVERHIRLLSAQARLVLGVAAVLGTSSAVVEIAALCDLPEAVLAAAVDEAVSAGLLLHTDAGHVAFRHDVIRQAVLAGMPAAVASALQHRVAHLLIDLGRPAERCVPHLSASALLDTSCVQWLAGNAREIIRRLPNEAIDLFARARDVVGLSDAARQQLVVSLALGLLWSGRLLEADTVAQEHAAAVSDPHLRSELALLLTRTSLYQGHAGKTLRHAELALAEDIPDRNLRRRIECMRAIGLNSIGRMAEGRQVGEAVLQEALAEGDGVAVVHLMQLIGGIEMMSFEFEKAISTIERGLQAVPSAPTEPFTVVTLHVIKATSEMELDRHDDARATLVAGLDAVEIGTGAATAWYHSIWAQLRYQVGEWDDALADALTGTGADYYDDDEFNVTRATLGLEALIRLRRGEIDEGRDVLTRVPAINGQINSFGWWTDWARAVLHDLDGRPEEALEAMWQSLTGPVESGRCLSMVLPDAARTAVAVGDTDRLAGLGELVDSYLQRRRTRGTEAAGMLLRAVRSQDSSAALLAADLYQATRQPLPVAQCREFAAVFAARAGHPDAGSAFHQALAGYRSLGANTDVQRVKSACAEFGFALLEADRGGNAAGWGALTASEQAVVRHVADGMTNSQIGIELGITRDVVGHHMQAVMRKCGLQSRNDVAALVS